MTKIEADNALKKSVPQYNDMLDMKKMLDEAAEIILNPFTRDNKREYWLRQWFGKEYTR